MTREPTPSKMGRRRTVLLTAIIGCSLSGLCSFGKFTSRYRFGYYRFGSFRSLPAPPGPKPGPDLACGEILVQSCLFRCRAPLLLLRNFGRSGIVGGCWRRSASLLAQRAVEVLARNVRCSVLLARLARLSRHCEPLFAGLSQQLRLNRDARRFRRALPGSYFPKQRTLRYTVLRRNAVLQVRPLDKEVAAKKGFVATQPPEGRIALPWKPFCSPPQTGRRHGLRGA